MDKKRIDMVNIRYDKVDMTEEEYTTLTVEMGLKRCGDCGKHFIDGQHHGEETLLKKCVLCFARYCRAKKNKEGAKERLAKQKKKAAEEWSKFDNIEVSGEDNGMATE